MSDRLRNYVANVIGEDLVEDDMPVESRPAPLRLGDEGLLVLYGDTQTGVTVVVAASDPDDAERRILATFSDSAYIDCIDLSVDQRPLSINLTAGLVPDEAVARRLLEMDAENTAA